MTAAILTVVANSIAILSHGFDHGNGAEDHAIFPLGYPARIEDPLADWLHELRRS